jgi:hypothetical protein
VGYVLLLRQKKCPIPAGARRQAMDRGPRSRDGRGRERGKGKGKGDEDEDEGYLTQ